MYLSLLLIDSRLTVARAWLGNPYRVHQRLLMAFPGHQPERLLFRVEPEWELPRLLVQAEQEAEWDVAFADLPVLAEPPRQKTYEADFTLGEMLRFRLRANPTKRLSAGRPGEKVDGPRVGLFKEDDQRGWLARKGVLAGFEPLEFDIEPLGTIVSRKNPAKDKTRQSHLVVEYQGRLRVLDPDALKLAVGHGIGASKAYGNGLLSLARV
ncbi:MAG: type I-E CRISPR-associated protein Cas6/Cse3/CasE [Thermoleophilia bacterium]